MIGTTCDVISSALRLWRSVCLYIHPAWVVCHLSLLTGSEGLGRGVSGQQPAFFMNLSGNRDLLDRHLVAFFASRKATLHDAQLAHQWAEAICQTDNVVISGFHSPLEKEVLDILLKNQHPVVIVLSRALYKKVPPHLQEAFEEGRLLFVSIREYSRHSWKSAEIRNWHAAGMADEVYFTQFDDTSTLSTPHYTIDYYGNTPTYILE